MSEHDWILTAIIGYFIITFTMIFLVHRVLCGMNSTLILLLESQKYNLDLHVKSGYVFVEHDKRLKVLEKVDLSNCKFEGE